MPIRVLIVDDNAPLRTALKRICGDQDDIEVVAEVGEGHAAVRLVTKLSLDVVVMDVRLPDLNGNDATRRIKAQRPDLGVVMVSAHADRWTAAEAMNAGALAFLLKDAAVDELRPAIRAAAAGQVFQSPALARSLARG